MNARRRAISQEPARQHLYLAGNFWDSLWIVQQPICNEIRRHDRVLYVERFVSVFTVARYPHLWPRLFSWLRGARTVAPNLLVLAPLPLFHLGHRFPWLFRVEFVLQRLWILWWARGLRGGTRILWVDNPMYECAIGRMGERLAIYHIGDEFSAFPSSHAPTAEKLEHRLLEKVQLAFAAAERLAADKRVWQPHTRTIWNAVDPQLYDAPVPANALAEIEAIPAPRVAFVGVLDTWVDIELLVRVATEIREAHFVVVGPSRVDVESLRRQTNVHFIGSRDRTVIPGVLRLCSASLVPFRRTTLTERVVPLKIFEALAAGTQPVCTCFSPDLEMLEREGVITVARSAEAFIAAVRDAIARDGLRTRARLVEYGRLHSWSARWREMDQIIQHRLADRATTI
jgi:glycosyltransferase involved in cell wall biosynthesis